MKKILALAVLLYQTAMPIIGNSQTDNNKTTVAPIELKFDTAYKNKEGSKTTKQDKQTTPKPITLKKPTSADTIRMMAKKFYFSAADKAKEKDYQGAIIDYSKSLSFNKSPITLTKRAYAYLLINKYDSAIFDSKEAMTMLPKNFEACSIMGIAYYEKKEYEEALATFRKANQLNPKNPDPTIFNYMAAIKFLQRDYKTALLYYDTVVGRDSTFQDVYTNRGMMHHYMGNYSDAIDNYTKALALDSTNANAYNNRGGAELLIKDYTAAVKDLDKAISLNPKYSNAYENRGKAKKELGDLAGACADWTTALTLGSGSSKELIIKFCK